MTEPLNSKPSSPYVSPGMPALDMNGKTTSFFEFWPTWAVYIPVVLQWLVLSVRHRSLTLPLLANPKLPLAGMVGVGKSELLIQATGSCDKAVLPWLKVNRSGAPLARQVEDLLQIMQQRGLQFPLVGKPDIGCRGAGVKLLHNRQQLQDCLDSYPMNSAMLLQKLASYEAEAGVFFVRHPDQPAGEIISLALKYTPYVVGDGQSSLKQLIQSDPRASDLQHLYLSRHQDKLEEIIEQGKPYKLVFSASHCRGAIFRDANQLITPELNAAINKMMADLPEFYYGRMDIKFADIEHLQQGKDLEIVEINSASSESLHIWDRKTPFSEAMRSLLFQYKTLFELGAANRKRGYQPPKLKELLVRWKHERELTAYYPETD
ncbi:D-alanine--D-alanine ligase [Agarivorans sp. MS3-6]|uniref:D-alanine--D-alanine ligase n=1 Tax=Agarivorans sp. TSD2052 TaxID=2937286 RepID=UPI00200F81EC|nr:D-alanine--D-alanine ligase [Agarivorans sp. TSD2052]UPW18410.1 D-alanine--D-alanine ligase [Agarivorans sp. TSD2052]